MVLIQTYYIVLEDGSVYEVSKTAYDYGMWLSKNTPKKANTDIVEETKVEEDKMAKQADTSNTYDIASVKKLYSSIRKGESVSLEQMRSAVDTLLLNHGESIKAELSKLKNDELKKQLSVFDRGRSTKKG